MPKTNFSSTVKAGVQLAMKASDSISLAHAAPSLFQIAAFFEDFFPADGRRRPFVSKTHLPVAEYLLNPEKLLNLLRSAKPESVSRSDAAKEAATKRPPRNAFKKNASPMTGIKTDEDGVGDVKVRPTGSPGTALTTNGAQGVTDAKRPLPVLPRKVNFLLNSPAANSVKLAGDFTGWQDHPVEMMHSPEGMWFTVVPLAPGSYTYRFIVDGQWCDDPNAERVANPFGSENAIIHVT